MSRPSTIIAAVAALFAAAALPARAQTVQVRPDHDNYTEDLAGVQDHTDNLSMGDTNLRQAYLKFDISGLPTNGVVVLSAVLTMRTRNDFSGDAIANVYSVDDDTWDETTIEDSNEPPLGPVIGTFDIEGTNTLAHPAGTSQLDDIDVTAWVAENFNSSDSLISIGLVELGSSITFFRADEHSDQSEHPWALLTVTVGAPGPGLLEVRPGHDGWTEAGLGVQDHIGNQAYGSNVGRQAYLKFDIGSLGSNQTITSASLTMRTRNDTITDSIAILYEVADDSWLETTLEDSNKPALGPSIIVWDIEGTVTLNHDPGTSQLDVLDVTSWVTSNYDSLDTLISFGIVEFESNRTFYRGDEHNDQSEHPWALLSVVTEAPTAAHTNVTVDNVVELRFESISGLEYQLEYSDNVTDAASWTNKNFTVTGSGQIDTLFDSETGADASRNYRIVTPSN
jgi:hypothetical protein